MAPNPFACSDCRNQTLRRISLWLLAMLASLTLTARDGTLRFSHTEHSLQPGEVVLYDIRSSEPLKQLLINVFERKFPAFAVDEGLHWRGLIGIDRDCRPGHYEVTVTGVTANGNEYTGSDSLNVLSKKFPTRILTVEPKYVNPPEKVQERIRKERELVDAVFEKTSPDKLWKGGFLRPVPGEVISEFGKRSVYNGEPRSAHSGTDFRGAVGTPVQAPNAGLVVFTGDLYYTGNTVIIDHGLGLYSYFGHMSAITVKEGSEVKAGDMVGQVGATGRVTGPHLHWTVRLRLSRVDPISLMDILKPEGEIQ